ncbi:hypothetical protein D3C83_237650 [compost metagenome]
MSSNLPAGFFAAGRAGASLRGSPGSAGAVAARGSPDPAREPSICITSPRISVL